MLNNRTSRAKQWHNEKLNAGNMDYEVKKKRSELSEFRKKADELAKKKYGKTMLEITHEQAVEIESILSKG